MNKILKLTALTLLTLVVLSPLVMAGSKPTFRHNPGFGSGSGFNHNNFNTFNKFKTFSTSGVTFNTGPTFVPPTQFGATSFKFVKKQGFNFDHDFFFHNGQLIRRR
jgi:hypothetical protein